MSELLDRYPFNCSACGLEQAAAPSLMMRAFGINTGHVTCGGLPKKLPAGCGAFLHVEITPDLSGDRMTSEPWDAYLQRETQGEGSANVL